MTLQPCNADLIETFYRTYNDTSGSQQVRLARCQAIVEALRGCAELEPGYAPWRLLFEGILSNERERDWGRGERLFRAALAAGQGRDRLLEARACIALAVTCHHLDRWTEAIDLCRQALAALEGLDKPVDVASAWIDMAISCSTGYNHGAFGPKALSEGAGYCQQALAALASLSANRERASLEAFACNTLGNLHFLAGRWHDALEAYQRHYAICQDAGYVCRTGISLDNQGEVYEQLGPAYYAQALAAHRAALEIHRSCEDTYRAFHSLLHLGALARSAGEPRQALAHYLEAIQLVEEIRLGVSTAEARAGFFATVAQAYADATLLAVELGQVATGFDLAERARSRAFLDLLAAGSADLPRHVEAPALSLDDVRAALPLDAVLIEYFTSGLLEAKERRASRRAAGDAGRLPPAKTLAFAVTQERVEVHDLDLSPNDLLPQQLRGAAERHFLQPAIRRTLYDRLVGPLAHLLAGKHRLYLAPHGPLHYVPFQALLAPDGETLLRDGGPELVYGLSASVLFRHRSAKPLGFSQTPRVSDAPCLALGYNGHGSQPLRFAENEALAIAALLGGEALVGPAGKREALFTRGPAVRYLHISCHGEFDPDAPLESLLHLGAEETLTAHQVLDGLRLDCDLVTLSACESGLSRVRRGDELMGLVRAFMLAGAPAVIATQWRVDERSTRILMQEFYRRVAAGASFAAALQQAQLYLRTLDKDETTGVPAGAGRPFADPFYWAPFILVGAA